MKALENIALGVSPLTGEIYIFRHGKKSPGVALEKRLAEREVIQAITEYMLHDAPRGATKDYAFGDKWYCLTVKPIAAPLGEK